MAFLGTPARRLSLRAHFGADRHADALPTLYFGLFTNDPFAGGVEVAGTNGYARVAVANNLAMWGTVAALQTSIASLADVIWPAATGAWSSGAPLVYWGIYDTATLGSGALWYAAQIGSGSIAAAASGDQPRILAGGITIVQGA